MNSNEQCVLSAICKSLYWDLQNMLNNQRHSVTNAFLLGQHKSECSLKLSCQQVIIGHVLCLQGLKSNVSKFYHSYLVQIGCLQLHSLRIICVKKPFQSAFVTLKQVNFAKCRSNCVNKPFQSASVTSVTLKVAQFCQLVQKLFCQYNKPFQACLEQIGCLQLHSVRSNCVKMPFQATRVTPVTSLKSRPYLQITSILHIKDVPKMHIYLVQIGCL